MSFAVSNYTPVPQVQVDIASHRRRTEQFPRTAGQASSLRPLILAARPPPATKPAREIPRKSNRDVRKEGTSDPISPEKISEKTISALLLANLG